MVTHRPRALVLGTFVLIACLLVSAPSLARSRSRVAASPETPSPELSLETNSASPTRVLFTVSLAEALPRRTWQRLVLTLEDEEGRARFRAMFNPSDRTEKGLPPGEFAAHDLDGGIAKQKAGGVVLLPDSKAERKKGRLRVTWALGLEKPVPVDRRPHRLWLRVIPAGGGESFLYYLGRLNGKGFQAVDTAPPATPRPLPGKPRYAQIFDYGEYLLNMAGDWVATLRTWSRIYRHEVPAATFYTTLERRLVRLMGALREEGEGFWLGGQHYTVGDLYSWLRENLLLRPDTLHALVPVKGELPLARAVYLFVVLGRPHPRPLDNPLLEPVAPEVDLEQALASPDPWLVSAALFLARKGYGTLKPQAVLERWGRLPHLWDQVCTDQALLYLASRPRQEWQTLQAENPDIQRELARLKPIPAGKRGWVEVWTLWRGADAFLSPRYLGAVGCPKLRLTSWREAQGRATTRRWKGDGGPRWQPDQRRQTGPQDCRKGYLALPAGRYGLDFLGHHAHGRSRIFTCQEGHLTRVVITVTPHI